MPTSVVPKLLQPVLDQLWHVRSPAVLQPHCVSSCIWRLLPIAYQSTGNTTSSQLPLPPATSATPSGYPCPSVPKANLYDATAQIEILQKNVKELQTVRGAETQVRLWNLEVQAKMSVAYYEESNA
ncbi:hypothetical protein FRC12_004871 [Ceratobasidium sp. 428]|nr:hypothetical protein FRC12_004871 [Ceratobasidium sp. 428]